VEEWVKAGSKVYSCYEAGPCGYWYHRELTKCGGRLFVLCLTGLEKPSQDNAEYINSGTAIWSSLATKGATLLGIRFE
jgi:hypothetical protein